MSRIRRGDYLFNPLGFCCLLFCWHPPRYENGLKYVIVKLLFCLACCLNRKRMQTRILLILFHVTPLLSICQTCIVAVKSKNKVVIAADSRVAQTTIGNNETTEDYADTACKIVSNGQFGIAYEGHGGQQCMNTARYALQTFSSPSQIKDYFLNTTRTLLEKYEDSLLLLPYPSVLEYVEKNYPTGMQHMLGGIFFFGYQADSVIFETWYLQRIALNDGHYHDVWFLRKISDTVAFGEVTEIYANGILSNKSTWAKGVIPGIISVINYSHDHHPTHVGGPIDIIEVTPKRSKWLQKKPICN
jgi:hypothetical protein